MAISYVGGQQGGRAGSTSTSNVTFSLSGGSNSTPLAGDLVVISITVGSTADRAVSVVSPTGYTSLTERYQNDTYDVNLGLSYKFMGSTPDTTFQLPSTGSANDAQRYTVHVYRGVDTNSPMDVAAVGVGANDSRTVNPSAITPVTSGAWIHVVGASANATGGTYTAGYLTAFLAGTTADTNDASMGAGYYSGWTSGAYDPAAFGGGGTTTTNDSWAAYTVALRPAAAGGSVGSNTATAANYLSRTFTSEAVLSYGSWFYIDAIDPSDSTAIVAMSGGSAVFLIGVGSDGAVETFRVSDSTYSTILSPGSVSAGDWLYLGLGINGASARGYASLENAASVAVDVGGPSSSVDELRLLVYPGGFNPLGAHVSHTRAWEAYLTQAEWDSEKNAADAARTTDLLFDNDLPDTANYGGWTSNGSLTTGPICPYISAGTVYNASITESMTLADSQVAVALIAATITEPMSLAETQTAVFIAVATVNEAMTLADSQDASVTGGGTVYDVTIVEVMALADSASAAHTMPATISEALSLLDSQQCQQVFSAQATEAMALADSQVAAHVVTAAVTETMTLADSSAASAMLTAVIQELVNLGDAAGTQMVATAAVTEAMNLGDSAEAQGDEPEVPGAFSRVNDRKSFT
jgi:hypothetical protein